MSVYTLAAAGIHNTIYIRHHPSFPQQIPIFTYLWYLDSRTCIIILQQDKNPLQIPPLSNFLHNLDEISFLDVVKLAKLETALGALAHLRNLLLAVLD